MSQIIDTFRPQPPRVVSQLLGAGLYDAALVAMQPLPGAVLRSPEQNEHLAAALTGLKRATDARQQREGAVPRHALTVGLESGEVAAISAALAAGAQPDASHTQQLVERLGDVATPDVGLTIWRVLVRWWLEHPAAAGFGQCLVATAAAANLSAPTRVAMATTLAAQLGPSHYADAAVRRACCDLVRGGGAALPLPALVALLDGLAASARPRVEQLLCTTDAPGTLFVARAIALLERCAPPGQAGSYALMHGLAVVATNAANLLRLRELGVDLAARDPATDATFLHAHDWQAAGGAQALRCALAAGADPWVRNRQGILPLAHARHHEAGQVMADERWRRRLAHWRDLSARVRDGGRFCREEWAVLGYGTGMAALCASLGLIMAETARYQDVEPRPPPNFLFLGVAAGFGGVYVALHSSFLARRHSKRYAHFFG